MAGSDDSSSIKDAVAMILAGGQGQRLLPLTRRRPKPAIRFAANYRIIDFTLSNCVNSNLKRINLLTQFAATSLYRHIQQGWSDLFVEELGEFIDTVPPQKIFTDRWYAATADAIYQNLFILQEQRPPWVFVLSGDHAYRMDYQLMLNQHIASGAQLTIACQPLPRQQCTDLGVMETDQSGHIIGFEEKPVTPKPIPTSPDHSLVSMGVYLWDTEELARQVAQDATTDSSHDFGRDIVPGMVEQESPIMAYQFTSSPGGGPAYWRDIGTLDSYQQSNMDLLGVSPELDLYDEHWPIYSQRGQYPAAKIASSEAEASLEECLISPGCIISGGRLRRSLLSPGVYVAEGAEVTESILMDNVSVGPDAQLHRAIVDEEVEIPAGCTIGLDRTQDEKKFIVTNSGITVVRADAALE